MNAGAINNAGQPVSVNIQSAPIKNIVSINEIRNNVYFLSLDWINGTQNATEIIKMGAIHNVCQPALAIKILSKIPKSKKKRNEFSNLV